MIGTMELLELVKNKKLVENLCEREISNPEGAGFDLRAGEIYIIKEGEAFLGENERHTPETECIAKYDINKDYVLKPGEYVLVKTIEKLNTPYNIAPHVKPRSTLQRCGVGLYVAPISPGYSGELTFGMCNHGRNNFKIEMGARIAHIQFFKTGENISAYRGQWQGGRVSTEGKKEVQV